jgi:hypothetical protein
MSIGKTPRTCNDFHLLATACKHDSIGKNETVRGKAVVTANHAKQHAGRTIVQTRAADHA